MTSSQNLPETPIVAHFRTLDDLPYDLFYLIARDWSAAELLNLARINRKIYYNVAPLLSAALRKYALREPDKEPLRRAITDNQIGLVRSFLRAGVDPNCFIAGGLRLVMLAVHHGHFKMVKLLVKNGADPSLKHKETTVDALTLAASAKNERMVKSLLSLGAQPSLRAIIEVTQRCSVRTLRAITKGVSSEVFEEPAPPNKDRNLFMTAVFNTDWPEMIDELYRKMPENLDLPNEHDLTPLMYSVFYNNEAAFDKLLLKYGASPSKREKKGCNVLHIALWLRRFKMAEKIINQPNAPLNDKEFANWRTPLIESLVVKHQSLSLLLIKRGADVNMTDDQLKTPLHFAVEQNCLAAVAALLKNGANPSKRDSQTHETPRQLALRLGHYQAAWLIEPPTENELAEAVNAARDNQG